MTIITSTLADHATSASEPTHENVHTAAGHLYDAECAFHNANQTHVDAWILAASDRLHSAIATYLAAVATANSVTARPGLQE